MQTFLPYPNFKLSFQHLDPDRIANQVQRETPTLLGGGWENHPASMMWWDHFGCLALYGLVGCAVLQQRRPWMDLTATVDLCMQAWEDYAHQRHPPHWFGDEAFHAAHRSNLLRKAPRWYARYGWQEPPTLDYVWPI